MIMRTLRESFIPLLGVLLGLVGLTAYFDGRAADLAKKETVIDLAPVAAGWDAGRLTENGMVEANAGAEVEASDRPEILAARDHERLGELDEAMKIVGDALAKTAADAPEAPLFACELAVIALKQGKLDVAAKTLDDVLAAHPSLVSAHFNRALVATRARQSALARAEYGKVLGLEPNHFEAHFNLGLLELDAGHLAEATAALERAVQSGSGMAKARALFSLGVAQARAGKEDQALASYEKSIEYAPSYLLPRYNQAVILIARKDPASKEAAAHVVAQMIALSPDFAPAWFLKGRLASEAGDLEAALAAYEKAAAHDPTFFKARYNAALVALDMDKITLAEQRFQRLVVDFPDRAEPLFNLARLAHKRDDQQTAIEDYQKAIAIKKGDYPEAQLNLAVSQRAAGKLDEALATLDQLLVAQPTMSSAQLNRGLVLTKLKRPDDARKALEAAIAMKPDYAFAWYNLGKLEAGLERHDAAIAAYRKALDADASMVKAAINLGVEEARLERWDEAIAAYRQAIALAPNDAPAHFDLALALRSKGQLEDAVAEFQKVIELDEDHIGARKHLGATYGKLGQHDLAIRTFQQALDLDASNVAVRYNLAGELARVGKTDDARAELERVVRLEPTHRGASAALATIYAAQGKNQEVLALVAPFVANGKANAEMRAAEGAARLALGDVHGAEDAFSKAKALAAKDPDGERAAKDPAGKDAEPVPTP
ncbi:MAG: tetratricopeptide repeat protein [Myxococcota bacterium]